MLERVVPVPLKRWRRARAILTRRPPSGDGEQGQDSWEVKVRGAARTGDASWPSSWGRRSLPGGPGGETEKEKEKDKREGEEREMRARGGAAKCGGPQSMRWSRTGDAKGRGGRKKRARS